MFGYVEDRSEQMIRLEVGLANNTIRHAIANSDMDRAQTLVSRKVGWRILLGEIPVKLRHIRL